MPIELVWHENKTTYLTIRKERKRLHMRVHKLFYNAPTPVLEALLKYAVKRDKRSQAVVKQMANLHFSSTQIEASPLLSEGKVYDLEEILARMKKLLPVRNVTIGWSDRKSRGRFYSITFGTYDHHTRQIRINPLLDDRAVPLYFLEYIVYHEMLHAVCPAEISDQGRCTVHTKAFREKEKKFPRFEEAKVWEKQSLMFFKKRQGRGRS